LSQINLFNNHLSLFERICSEDELKLAFKTVKANKGAPGTDGVTIEAFERNLDRELSQLKQELESWTYKPKPVRSVEIPKPDGGVRQLGVPSTRDRVVQASIKAVLEPIFDPKFSSSNYGFRPGKSQRQAVEAAQRIIQSGKEYVVDIDLSKFFDRINHDRLISQMKTIVPDARVLRLIGNILRSGIMKDGLVSATLEGSVQGSPLSPLLSNIVLDELDKHLESKQLEFCRWADDCNIFVRSQLAAERVMLKTTQFIEKKLKLKVNQEKSKVALSRFVKFLGMTFILGTLAISAKSMQKARDHIKEILPRGTSLTIEQSMSAVNKWYVGWANYHAMTQYPNQLYSLEAHVRRRIRSRIISQQKKKRHLVARLIERGIPRSRAYRTIYTNRKRWALSHTKVMEKAYPNSWFKQELGQEIRSNRELKHWFPVSRWIKIT
jgi:group II intron reverse transcriptase/maturase